ncbi:MAG: uracil-DNA glycosylase [Firmicutes bacterium]|nr:uracil-DNA glycosylase [Bacillota bacterium]
MKEPYLFDLLAGTKPCVRQVPHDAAVQAVRANPAAALAALQQEVAACSRCRLRKGATQTVFGEGNPQAKLMFVGEGPGADEDRLGRPFVGAAGKLLDKILAAAGFAREEVYIANVVKCRPPKNRLPVRDEVNACLPYLLRQLALIRPQIIVCLGALATQALIDDKARISVVRGRWFEKYNAKIMATYHPAALLRDATKKRPVWEDMKQVRDLYRTLQ